MSSRVISPRVQIGVLIALFALTGLTVAVSFLELSGASHVAAGLLIATAKASLIVLFFMHVIHSTAATRAVLAVAVFWLVGVLMMLTFSDYSTRGSVPFKPGH
jgi:cytochrome c oxidase subunit 4